MDKMAFAEPLGAMLKERRMLKDARHVAFLSHMALSMKVRAFPTRQYLEAGTIRADFVQVVHARPYAGSPGYGFDYGVAGGPERCATHRASDDSVRSQNVYHRQQRKGMGLLGAIWRNTANVP